MIGKMSYQFTDKSKSVLGFCCLSGIGKGCVQIFVRQRAYSFLKDLSVTITLRTSDVYSNFMIESIFPPVLLLEDIFERITPTSDMTDLSRRLGYER
jgi:hypothetical protein